MTVELVGLAPAAAAELRERYGAVCWWGRSTRTFWALVESEDGKRLVEALSPRELVTAIKHPEGWPWP
jgi:hypothetical protein